MYLRKRLADIRAWQRLKDQQHKFLPRTFVSMHCGSRAGKQQHVHIDNRCCNSLPSSQCTAVAVSAWRQKEAKRKDEEVLGPHIF